MINLLQLLGYTKIGDARAKALAADTTITKLALGYNEICRKISLLHEIYEKDKILNDLKTLEDTEMDKFIYGGVNDKV